MEVRQIPLVSFGIAPYDLLPLRPFGNSYKFHDPNPGIPLQEQGKMFYYIKNTHFFMHNQISKNPFCVISIVFGGQIEDLDFAEKSLDLGIKTN